MKRRYGILTLVTSLDVVEALKSKIVSMVYLVVSIIKLSSETWYTMANDHNSDRTMVHRSGIDDGLDEISHTCLLGRSAAIVKLAYEPGGFECCGARSRSIPVI